MALDETDIRLLRELQRDAGRPNVALAEAIGLSPAATLNRVRRLKRDGVITAIVARVDSRKAGLALEVYVSLTLDRHTDAANRRLAETVRALPQVVAGDWVAGETDVLLHVVARDLEDLQRVLVTLSSRGGAQRVVTLLRLNALKPEAPLPLA